jgi:hypothetical protein
MTCLAVMSDTSTILADNMPSGHSDTLLSYWPDDMPSGHPDYFGHFGLLSHLRHPSRQEQL